MDVPRPGRVPDELTDVAKRISSGDAPETTVRALLRWFGASRRFPNVIQEIREALDTLGLSTEPNFEFAYLDGDLEFVLKQSTNENGDVEVLSISEAEIPIADAWSDPTYRIGRLPSANIQGLVSVKPTADLQQAITLMVHHNYSQLPVMTSEREVKGLIDWKSIGIRLALGIVDPVASRYMTAHVEVSADASLFETLGVIQKYGYVLVRAADRRISGIVTESDVSDQFRVLSEPFILIGEIENYVRRIIGNHFTVAELRAVAEPRRPGDEVGKVSDLTFGEYIRLLEEPTRWKRLGLAMDRANMIALLDETRKIRNDIMHFDPDGIEPTDVQHLQDFVRLFQTLAGAGIIGPAYPAHAEKDGPKGV